MMRRKCFAALLLLALLAVSHTVDAQTGIYIPSAKPIKNMKAAMIHPETFCLLLQYSGSDSTYSINDLDILDSVYNIAFDRDNPRLYQMIIEGYGGENEALTRSRVDVLYRYFAYRCHAPFPIRYAANPIHCSCKGDTVELLRYEVPVERHVYNTAELPSSRTTFNQSIKLSNCVLITFKTNPDECIGLSRGCFVPSQDSTIRGYYASVFMKKGALYSVSNTKDSCPENVEFRIEEHLDWKEVLEHYFLVPHKKQIIVQVGYIVLHSNIHRDYGECTQELPDSIFVRFPVTNEQWENKVRIFGKKYSEKGVAFKSLTTKKVPSKISINIQTGINVTQLDTLFLGKRIQPEELKDYFYEVDTDMEEGSFQADGKYWKAYRLDKHGDYEIKKSLRQLMRIVEDTPEEIEEDPTDKRYADDEDIE
ncbi:MAG: hypothetical protein II532_02765 [Bacteroidales bacterium]|nr:hypothetical protein [Bacteroidales bacterium]